LALAQRLAAARDKDLVLRKAVQQGRPDEVERLLDEGANVNAAKDKYRSTVLMLASARGDLQLMSLLVARGADVNAGDADGWTALMGATVEGHVDAVKFLLDKGADVHATNSEGETALMMASRMNNTEIRDLFLKRGAKE
jgi:ankyrin repeat protein